jgi:hypothetical protein
MTKTSSVALLLSVACAISAARAQTGTDSARQAGKIQPTPQQRGKIAPNDGKLGGKIAPSDGKLNGKITPSDGKLSGKIEPTGPSGLKRTINFDKAMAASAAEKSYAAARLDEIDRIVFKAVPEMAHLSFPTFTQLHGFYASAPKANTILEYRYVLFADLGAGRYCSIFTAAINQGPQGTDEPWAQGPRGKPVAGTSFVLSELVPPPNPSYEQMLIARDGDAPYHQLTREEVRRWQIVDQEGANGEKLVERKKSLANTPYEQFMAEAPQRKKARDELRVILKGVQTPAAIAAQIKLMEDGERDVAAQLKAQLVEDRKTNDSISGAQSIADKARASIARMSAAERKLPAWVKQEGSDTLYNFGTTETPNVSRMIRANPEFWTMHRSRVEVRSIDLDFSAACPKEPPPPEVHRALWKLRQNIDLAALSRMVNERN